jgi:hypothetical protein
MHEPLRFKLNEPGYVAAFVVYPGSGVRLIYPTVDAAEQLQSAGYHSKDLFAASFDDDAYRAVLGPKVGSGPAYLYVIASRHPLEVGQYIHRPMRLANAVGRNAATSFYSDVAFDGIVNNAIALGDEQGWDADVYLLYSPGETAQRLEERHLTKLVQCANGAMIQVPQNYIFAGCPGDQQVLPRKAEKVAPKATASAQTSAPGLTGGGYTGGHAASVAEPPTRVAGRRAVADRGVGAGQADGAAEVASPAVPRSGAEKVTYSASVAPGIEMETTAPRSSASRVGSMHGMAVADRGEASPAADDNSRRAVAPRAPTTSKASPDRDAGAATTSAPARVAAPRTESQQRETRESLRTPPRPTTATSSASSSRGSESSKADPAPKP